jgi:hypothetical protein
VGTGHGVELLSGAAGQPRSRPIDLFRRETACLFDVAGLLPLAGDPTAARTDWALRFMSGFTASPPVWIRELSQRQLSRTDPLISASFGDVVFPREDNGHVAAELVDERETLRLQREPIAWN